MSPYRTNQNARLHSCENVWTHSCKDGGLNHLKHSFPVSFSWSSLSRWFEQCTRFHNAQTSVCQTFFLQYHAYKIHAHRQISTIAVTHVLHFYCSAFYS
jgi:hypothetical protein